MIADGSGAISLVNGQTEKLFGFPRRLFGRCHGRGQELFSGRSCAVRWNLLGRDQRARRAGNRRLVRRDGLRRHTVQRLFDRGLDGGAERRRRFDGRRQSRLVRRS
ncbi:MAG: hypothetical protein JO312_26875 [Hyphomicrobiales bacterium]|nr:hypothetical protein [Hyphomicrobiales bacterium]